MAVLDAVDVLVCVGVFSLVLVWVDVLVCVAV